jgi:hypothetical protein
MAETDKFSAENSFQICLTASEGTDHDARPYLLMFVSLEVPERHGTRNLAPSRT